MSQWNAEYSGVGLPGSPVTYNGERYSGVIFHPKVNATLYLENGLRHRTDGPAVEMTDGSKEWNFEGRLHRLDGPAIETADGSKVWFVDGLCHRLDGPAYEGADGDKVWYVDGERHRVDGPAVEEADGTKEWWIDNSLHRLDGPAIESPNGYKEWHVDGREVDIRAILGYEPSIPLNSDEQMLLILGS